MQIGFHELSQRRRYQEYRRRLDARAVLEHYGAENVREQTNGDGTVELIHSCLIDRVEPHHAHGDSNPSAACNIDKKVYICYQWWGGDLFHFIAKMEGKDTLADTLRVVERFLTGATQPDDTFRIEVEKLLAASGVGTIDLPSYSDRVLDAWSTPHPYWASRGISPEAIATLRLGFDPHECRVVFPHWVDGKLVGWQKRLVPETEPAWPKYRNSLGFPKAETLYNYDTAKKHPGVVVVESPMSVAKAITAGMPTVVATFGAKVTDPQIELLKRFNRVYVWFDADPAGTAGTRKLVTGLMPYTEVRVVYPDVGLDMADCNANQMAAKLLEAGPASLWLAMQNRTH